MSVRSLGLGLVSLLALGACTESRGPLGFQCEANSECQSPLVCRLTRCRRECTAARDCPPDSLCVRDEDGIGACRLPDEASCAMANECPAPLGCINGACAETCAEDRDCPPGSWCEGEPGMRACARVAAQGCTLSSECPTGLRCTSDGLCQPVCRQDLDCDFGEECGDDGVCAEIPATLDGGLDAGVDGGALDAGAPDADVPDGSIRCMGPSDCMAMGVTTAACTGGVCSIVDCASGFDDCDMSFATGCETPVSADPLNCGQCGGSCGHSGTCTAGVCDTVVDLSLGAGHFCVVRSSNDVVCMGSNRWGELSRGTTSASEPMLGPAFMTVATDVEAGAGSTCFLAGPEGGCVGNDQQGQAGNGGGFETTVLLPGNNLGGLLDIEQLAVGGAYVTGTDDVETGFACLRRTGGEVRCWGSAVQRGDNGGANTDVPVTVPGLFATDITAGARHVCAIRLDRSVVCWGAGETWLGSTGTMDRPTPTAVGPFTDATDIDAGEGHTCVRHATGAVSCWGDGRRLQLGRIVPGGLWPTPLDIMGLTDAVEVESGTDTSCALRTGGRVSCWGDNSSGGLGIGSTMAVGPGAMEVVGLTDAVALTIGNQRACALRANGAIACWGGRGSDFGAADPTLWTQPTDHPEFPATPTP